MSNAQNIKCFRTHESSLFPVGKGKGAMLSLSCGPNPVMFPMSSVTPSYPQLPWICPQSKAVHPDLSSQSCFWGPVGLLRKKSSPNWKIWASNNADGGLNFDILWGMVCKKSWVGSASVAPRGVTFEEPISRAQPCVDLCSVDPLL